MSLNGHCLRETTHQNAVNCFREAKKKIEVVISRMVESKLQKGINFFCFVGKCFIKRSCRVFCQKN